MPESPSTLETPSSLLDDIAPRTPPPEVSVVIPTYRRVNLLLRCLRALTSQTLAPGRFEIIVADDACETDARLAVEKFAAGVANSGLTVCYLPVPATQGPAGARNRGWEQALAPIIAFTDDDTVPDEHWLEDGLGAFSSDIAAVAGGVEVPLPARPSDHEVDCAALKHAEFASANCFVRRDMLQRIGGFDERFTAAWREGSDLQFSIMAAGGHIASAPYAKVVHPVRPVPWGASMAQQRKSQFDALLYRKHRQLYKRRIATPRPWLYYLIVLCLVAVPVALAAELPGLALGAAVLWALLTLGFAVRRLWRTSHAGPHVAEMLWTSVLIPPLAVFWRLYGAVRFRAAFL
jgi:glycosyltransferase involved in cell wall biosynthesis